MRGVANEMVWQEEVWRVRGCGRMKCDRRGCVAG